ncbi:MAG: O-phosphoserine--tRNA(Cys) ligase [Candidatus Syntrophoarchaeum sp. GoM_oil]|nr:MAG: O-phosphoserine--tRNA(Cys) ligase [Candidatus Syntrophoarchaeum sp. GoM_oil]
MRFDPEKLKTASWEEGKKYLDSVGINDRYPRRFIRSGRVHPVFETVERLREAYLRLGFEEAMNPLIVEERDVYRQFGKEALAVLDRCFYLAGLPHPNIGISDERIASMRDILEKDLTEDDVEIVREIFHAYKKGKVEGDDLVYEISSKIDVPDYRVVSMLDTVFPEFKELIPEPTRDTLRSHMTSGWFITLKNLIGKHPLPINLFSVDRCFRREQREDATRLKTYFSASCVMVEDVITIDDGKTISEALLRQFGFKDFRFRLDEKRSKYYIPDTQIEVFAYHPKLLGSSTKYADGWIEIATFGVYSPSALSNYDIPYTVMNLGLGVERLAMILYDATDLRELTFPQFYTDLELSDLEIARTIRVKSIPSSREGEELARAIVKVCMENGGEQSPCEYSAWEGNFFGEAKTVKVDVIEPEENTRLCGPAFMNEIVVNDGNIYGIPRIDKWKKIFDEGVNTGIRFIDAFAAEAAADIERSAIKGEGFEARIRIVKTHGDINIEIDPVTMNFVTGRNKKIDLRGPVFTTVRSEIL